MTDEYQRQVGDIIAGQPRDSSYVPSEPVELFIRNRRAVGSLEDLAPIEQQQLARIWRGEDVAARLARGGFRDEELDEEFPDDLEVAEVVDDKGAVRYRLWGMNYGVIFLLGGDSLECFGFACQHDVEHWSLEQRPLFWAMDRALRRGGHGFQQGSKFCWWEQKCWDELAGKTAGNVQSERSVRAMFAGEN